MSEEQKELPVEETGPFSPGNVERFGWGIFLLLTGVSLYAEDLREIRDAWDFIGLYGGGFLLAFWVAARAFGKSLSYWMLATGSIIFIGWFLDTYDLNVRVVPLVVIIMGIALLIKAITNNRS